MTSRRSSYGGYNCSSAEVQTTSPDSYSSANFLFIRTALVSFQDRPSTEWAEVGDQIAALQPTTAINAVSSDNGSFESHLDRLEWLFDKFLQCNAMANRQLTTAIQDAVAHRRLPDAASYPQPDQAGVPHPQAPGD
ncbi:hypothetical protein T10_1550 [Trichinella papuae]|uniref:Uncharacterized protein n=1 Tax=Trichinella papuae TaxID=268474 RepID=A0A0V1MGP8_9BILA|nr:hypothetical protein T10_1550 [Trichinella papuae]